MAQQDNTVG